jgi:hypothetical protein
MPAKRSVDRKPSLLCLGRVSAVAAPVLGSKGTYCHNKVDVDPVAAGKSGSKYLCWYPDWFAASFTPDKDLAGNETFVYDTNVGRPDPDPKKMKLGPIGVSALNAFLGGDEGVAALDRYILENVTAFTREDGGIEAVGNPIRDAIIAAAEAGLAFGYLMTQKMDRTGTFDENGREKKVRTPYYEVAEFFSASKSSKKRLESMVQYAEMIAKRNKTEGKDFTEPMVQLTFDLSDLD